MSHLQQALNKQQIKVLIDHKLPKGHNIWSSLLNAIERTHVSVVVFSQNYASSKWCLDELVKILDTMKQQGQVVLPVFYGIDPTHVRNQLGSFKQVFETHVQKFDPIVVQDWKIAITEAANLISWDSKSPYIRDDDDLIQQLVKMF
ncbi:TMV resistance protein N-like [Arachis ipaensis]|uniref:TMV resistance protein N-like n=1 Tax=Arachis ipaensis TaxID=130454 RepID=UPI0007AF8943|nr:TMV resistance protein N-like [Arachis ipaensis]